MRIGVDAKRLFNNFTGIGNFSRTLIDVITTYAPEWEYVLYTPRVKENSTTRPYLRLPHCETRVPRGMVRGSLWRTFAMSSSLKVDAIDIYHGLSNELPVGISVPSVVTIHDVAFRPFTDMYSWVERRLYDMKWRHACRVADRIVAISQNTKQDIVEYYDVDPAKIEVIYQPVAPCYYEEGEARREDLAIDGKFLLYVGTVNSRKNLLGAVRALQLLPREVQIPLLVVGGGSDYLRKVKTYVADNHLGHLVIFPERRIYGEELHNLYLSAEGLVYPSFYEGFGLPVVEALLSRCPVLTSNVSSLPEAAGPDSLLADPTDVEDIAKKMERMLTDTNLREHMKEAGRAYAMRMFSAEACALAHKELYSNLLGNPL